MKKTALLIVTGKDRPGIIARVTEVLYRKQCNLEDISMTILEGSLAMIMIVHFNTAAKDALDASLERTAKALSLSLDWQPVKTLQRNHRDREQPLYLISAIGRDKTGIVYAVSRFLADQNLNIMDLNSKILGQGKKALYAMVLEIKIPKKFSTDKLRKDLAKLAQRLHIDLSLRPVERLEL